jgi:hypothetical protein
MFSELRVITLLNYNENSNDDEEVDYKEKGGIQYQFLIRFERLRGIHFGYNIKSGL